MEPSIHTSKTILITNNGNISAIPCFIGFSQGLDVR